MNASARKKLMALSDPILGPLIAASDEERESAIPPLLERARAVCDRVLQRQFGPDWLLREEDAAEVRSLLALRLMRRLRALVANEQLAIRHFDDYVAMLTNNAAYDVLRLRFPERARLKSRLRYVLSTDLRFALWLAEGYTVCGLKRWEGQRPMSADASRLEEVLPRIQLDRERIDATLLAIFRATEAPVRLGALVHALALHWELSDHAGDMGGLEELAVDAPLQDAALEQRQRVARLWEEVRQLPPRQRIALFLNMRDAKGNNALQLFVILGLTTLEELAGLAEMPFATFLALWDELPVDDKRISALLGVTRQQVINLRKSARERLARRMRT